MSCVGPVPVNWYSWYMYCGDITQYYGRLTSNSEFLVQVLCEGYVYKPTLIVNF